MSQAKRADIDAEQMWHTIAQLKNQLHQQAQVIAHLEDQLVPILAEADMDEEDRADLQTARAALAEKGDNTPLEDVNKGPTIKNA
ncbi:MAG: hypothetical protein GKR89_13965 [Candidatus Latescibacteria bacterium]|nr:hypothetical protein [Candidatus Latescibacterota bacterium]